MSSTTRLLLMRHAKSDWYSGEGDDFLRPLSDRGKRDARHMGRWLAQSGHLPAVILSSPSRRTRQTLDLVAEGAGVNLLARTDWRDVLYLASSAAIRTLLAHEYARDALMLLGHNPGLEELLAFLVGDSGVAAGFNKNFPTGAVYVLEMACGLDELSSACARVVAHQRPKALSG